MATPIGTLGTIPTITVGGRVFTDLTNLIILFAVCNDATNTYSGLIKQGGGSTSYQVTTGKTLTINALTTVIQNVSGSQSLADMGQCDNALALNTASTPTNPLYFSSNSSTHFGLIIPPVGGGGSVSQAGVYNSIAIAGKIASQKFGVFYGGASTLGLSVLAYGYEA